MRNFLLLIFLAQLLLLVSCGEQDAGRATTGEAADTVLEPPRYVIRQNRFYQLVSGELISDAADRLEVSNEQEGSDGTPVYRILGEEGEDIGYVVPSARDPLRIGDIHVTTPKAATEGDIRVGHSFSRMRIAHPVVAVRREQPDGPVYAYTRYKAFQLDMAGGGVGDISPEDIPADTRIREIIVVDQGNGEPLKI